MQHKPRRQDIFFQHTDCETMSECDNMIKPHTSYLVTYIICVHCTLVPLKPQDDATAVFLNYYSYIAVYFLRFCGVIVLMLMLLQKESRCYQIISHLILLETDIHIKHSCKCLPSPMPYHFKVIQNSNTT